MRREDEEGISAGRYVNPGVLPPTRTYRLQAGRFVQPAADNLLPGMRTARLEIDWANAYHFGEKVGAGFRRDE